MAWTPLPRCSMPWRPPRRRRQRCSTSSRKYSKADSRIGCGFRLPVQLDLPTPVDSFGLRGADAAGPGRLRHARPRALRVLGGGCGCHPGAGREDGGDRVGAGARHRAGGVRGAGRGDSWSVRLTCFFERLAEASRHFDSPLSPFVACDMLGDPSRGCGTGSPSAVRSMPRSTSRVG